MWRFECATAAYIHTLLCVYIVVEYRWSPCQIFGALISVLYQTLIAWRSQECKHVNASFRSVFETLRKEAMMSC